MTGKILLTGGAGYIGSHTYVALKQAGYAPVILDNFSNAASDVVDKLAQLTGAEVPCVIGDILDQSLLDQMFKDHKFDAIVHFAAKKAVGESMAQPLSYFRNNTVGLLNLLEAMETHSVTRLVFSSSAMVYGEPEIQPILESVPLSFSNPYGFTKLTGEQILEQMCHAHPEWAIGRLRYFNPAGAHSSGLIADTPCNPDGSRRAPENLVPFIADVAAGLRDKINVFGNDYGTPDGTGVRDYIHINDLARGHVLSLASLLATDKGHTVNLGTGSGSSVLDVVNAYSKACGRELQWEFLPRRAGDVPMLVADVQAAKETLGFEAEFDIDQMCASSWNSVRMSNGT